MASLFPREEHAEALFHRILSNPGAEQQLYETFCMEQENASLSLIHIYAQAKVKKIMAPMFTAGRIKSENAMQYMLPRWLICESRKNRSS